jgi:hypothetical protein
MRYDFFVPSLDLLIEFNGKHHYERGSKGSEYLKKIQTCDNLKDVCIFKAFDVQMHAGIQRQLQPNVQCEQLTLRQSQPFMLRQLSLVRVTYDQLKPSKVSKIRALEDVIDDAVKLIKQGNRIIYTTIRFNSDVIKKYNLTEHVHQPTKIYYYPQYIYMG